MEINPNLIYQKCIKECADERCTFFRSNPFNNIIMTMVNYLGFHKFNKKYKFSVNEDKQKLTLKYKGIIDLSIIQNFFPNESIGEYLFIEDDKKLIFLFMKTFYQKNMDNLPPKNINIQNIIQYSKENDLKKVAEKYIEINSYSLLLEQLIVGHYYLTLVKNL
ncbi:MAG: hypothetical protein GF317_05830 [Candidatus Lokiarchaeota archaeon]|nr:hypothetical protein [Candidatus Lokiarchaeota archaeon]